MGSSWVLHSFPGWAELCPAAVLAGLAGEEACQDPGEGRREGAFLGGELWKSVWVWWFTLLMEEKCLTWVDLLLVYNVCLLGKPCCTPATSFDGDWELKESGAFGASVFPRPSSAGKGIKAKTIKNICAVDCKARDLVFQKGRVGDWSLPKQHGAPGCCPHLPMDGCGSTFRNSPALTKKPMVVAALQSKLAMVWPGHCLHQERDCIWKLVALVRLFFKSWLLRTYWWCQVNYQTR